MLQLEQLKAKLKQRGWTYRSAAEQLGVSYPYLSDVLNGHHSSRRLCQRIEALPAPTLRRKHRTNRQESK
jgi:transcriptional regulator with XRE-family HTH domain